MMEPDSVLVLCSRACCSSAIVCGAAEISIVWEDNAPGGWLQLTSESMTALKQ